jgi:hypothetical protein
VFEAVKKYLNRVRQRRQSYREGRRGTQFKIVHDPNRMSISWLTIENEAGHRSLTWQQVNSITAFKRDLWAVDQICLGIDLLDGSAIQLDEEMNGWDSLVHKLPEYLPGCKSFGEWFGRVAFPAFELNLTPIFKRIRSFDRADEQALGADSP